MPLLALLILIVVIALPIGWFVSEFRARRPVRIVLGFLAILCSFGVATVIGLLSELNYNAWYGATSKDLIDTTITQVEDGNINRVLKVLRGLNSQFIPTYESRAKYRSLVTEATARMRGDAQIEDGSEWDAQPFNSATWLGHWENDTGFWIVIDGVESSFGVVRSGCPGTIMHSVALSEACSVLSFREGTQWRHTLTLKNKYEAIHEWYDLEKNEVWETDHLHKLIRSTEDQRRMTQEPTEPDE
jgi:hypothetical protein